KWALEAAADLHGTGEADLIWRNIHNGRLLVWRMEALQVRDVNVVPTKPVANGWSIAGGGDFNADGRDDLMWRNDRTGQALVWLMRGSGVAGVRTLDPAPRLAGWRVQGVIDIDADGDPDLLWRNLDTGQNLTWMMNGL